MHNQISSFKLIGLRVLKDCSSSLRKVLCPETTYFFCNDYEDDGEGFVRKKAGIQELSPDFYRLDNAEGPFVNISCIVGQNGDGKSSLIELLIRLLNNFAYLGGFLSDYREMLFIPNLYVSLFYSVNSKLCCLESRGPEVSLKVGGNTTWRRQLQGGEKRYAKFIKKRISGHADVLFYNLVNNYSLYAYNSKDCNIENIRPNEADSWIDPLFQKNDQYQIPITLMPKRENGNIDVNQEYELSKQRLNESFLNRPENKFRINGNEVVEGFAYVLNKENKLISHIYSYLQNEDLRGKRAFYTITSKNRKKNVGIKTINLCDKDVLRHSLSFWQNIDDEFFNSGLLRRFRHTYLLSCHDLIEFLEILSDNAKSSKHKRARDNIELFISGGGNNFSFFQFQRLYLVLEVYKEWKKRLDLPDLRLLLTEDNVFRDSRIPAASYLVYKTIRLFEENPDYFAGGLSDYENPQHFFNDEVRENNIRKWFERLDEDLAVKRTHLTLKIRQTVHFLSTFDESPFAKKDENTAYADFLKDQYDGDFKYVDVNEYYAYIKDSDDFIGVMPPPIFTIDFLVSRNQSSVYSLSRMSSGERQLLNSASSIVYHLKNIFNSEARGTKIIYRNVNIILEEVELYFHPEYQRRFVKYLLEQIAYANISSEMAINLIFVTHSPFILSDIPRQNVLFLRDGRPDRSMQEDTFGANIHTLLQNGFFLNTVPIGEFAKDKINGMFALLNQSESISYEDMTRLEKEIPLVSEPLLRGQLMKLFAQRKAFAGKLREEYEARIKALEKMVESLNSQLYDKN